MLYIIKIDKDFTNLNKAYNFLNQLNKENKNLKNLEVSYIKKEIKFKSFIPKFIINLLTI